MKIIGDVHGKYNEYLKLLEDTEYSVQLGDFGFNYDCLETVDANKHKIILGNHDNRNDCNKPHILKSFGEVNLGPFKFFYVSGAFSLDMQSRVAYEQMTGHKSWWPNEQLSVQECEECLDMYNAVKPDCVLSHSCPAEISRLVGTHGMLQKFGWLENLTTQTQHLLQFMFNDWEPKLWIFGHYHRNWEKIVRNTRFICIDELNYVNVNERLEVS